MLSDARRIEAVSSTLGSQVIASGVCPCTLSHAGHGYPFSKTLDDKPNNYAFVALRERRWHVS